MNSRSGIVITVADVEVFDVGSDRENQRIVVTIADAERKHLVVTAAEVRLAGGESKVTLD